MASKKKTSRKKKAKTTRKYTKRSKSTSMNQIDEMTNSIGKLAITGATATMALGIGAGFANAFKSS